VLKLFPAEFREFLGALFGICADAKRSQAGVIQTPDLEIADSLTRNGILPESIIGRCLPVSPFREFERPQFLFTVCNPTILRGLITAAIPYG
jgi:hypothetical protein